MATVEYTGPLEGLVTFHGHRFSKGSPSVEMSDDEAQWFKGRQHFTVDGAALAEQSDEDIPEEDVRVLARETRDTLDEEARHAGRQLRDLLQLERRLDEGLLHHQRGGQAVVVPGRLADALEVAHGERAQDDLAARPAAVGVEQVRR